MKTCTKCKISKPKTEFGKYSRAKDGLRECCKECKKKDDAKYKERNKERIRARDREYSRNNKKLRKQWYEDNKEKISERRKERYQENKEEISKYNEEYRNDPKNKEKIREYQKQYREKNRKKMKAYLKEYKQDERNKKRRNKKQKQRYHSDNDFRMKVLIRKRFLEAFKNQGETKSKTLEKYNIDIDKIVEHLGEPPEGMENPHIDHIFPLSAFDYSDEEQVRISWLPENLQWLSEAENVSKKDTYDEKEFVQFLNAQKEPTQ